MPTIKGYHFLFLENDFDFIELNLYARRGKMVVMDPVRDCIVFITIIRDFIIK